MENKQTIWKESVNKAFYGFMAYTLLSGIIGAIVSMVSGAAGLASLANGGGGGALLGPIIVAIIAVAGYVYYFLGIKGMSESSVGYAIEDGTKKLFKGAKLGLIGAIIECIPLISIVGTILSIAGFVFMLIGFDMIRKSALNPQASKGAHQLWLVMVLTIVGAVISIIPLIGNIGSLICNILVIVYAFLGWRNFSNSELQ